MSGEQPDVSIEEARQICEEFIEARLKSFNERLALRSDVAKRTDISIL